MRRSEGCTNAQWGAPMRSIRRKWMAIWTNFFLLSPLSATVLKPNLRKEYSFYQELGVWQFTFQIYLDSGFSKSYLHCHLLSIKKEEFSLTTIHISYKEIGMVGRVGRSGNINPVSHYEQVVHLSSRFSPLDFNLPPRRRHRLAKPRPSVHLI